VHNRVAQSRRRLEFVHTDCQTNICQRRCMNLFMTTSFCFPNQAIHGDVPQKERESTLDAFRYTIVSHTWPISGPSP
jgi:hypothetical protein